MRYALALLAGSALLVAAAAAGQPATSIPQISDSNSSITENSTPSPPSTEAPDQLSRGTESAAPEEQLTIVRLLHSEPKQLSSRAPTAEPPQPLSKPSEGRTAAIEKISGSDRCDPALPRKKQSDTCKQVIETRAGEYARPLPTELSPEQQLLADQQLRSAGEPITDATHRLATSGEADDSTESMGIASIVLQQSQQQPDPKKKEEDPGAQAAVQAVMQSLNQSPQN